MAIKTLAFLVGCPRSGTTLLQSLIATHSRIASFPETQFFHYLLLREKKRRLLTFMFVASRLRPRLETFFRDELCRPELIDKLPQTPFSIVYTQKFFQILKELAIEQGGTVLLEKTPDHIYTIQYIEKFLPKAKFIHLVRNGADVIASLYEVTHKYPKPWGGARSIDMCIDNWLVAIQTTKKYVNKPNHLIVRYEKLVQDPQEVLENICKFLQIEFDSNMINNYAHQAAYVSFNKQGRSVDCTGIRVSKTRKFTQIFNSEQQEYILKKISAINLDELELFRDFTKS